MLSEKLKVASQICTQICFPFDYSDELVIKVERMVIVALQAIFHLCEERKHWWVRQTFNRKKNFIREVS